MTDKVTHIPESALFRSKVDKSILIILISSVLIAVPLIMNLRWLGIPYLIFTFVITLSIFFNTYYRIEKNILNVKSGVLYKKQIDIHSIYKIKEIKSFISAPALLLCPKSGWKYSIIDLTLSWLRPKRKQK